MRSVLLVYDVPTNLKITNPSEKLRALGFRMNLSCWVIPEHLIPWDYLYELPISVSWEIVRFDEKEKGKLRDLARKALEREAGQIRAAMEESIAKAQAKLAKVAFPDEALMCKARRATQIGLARAKRLLRKAEEAALAFDLLAEVNEAYGATRHAIGAAQAAYFAVEENEEALCA